MQKLGSIMAAALLATIASQPAQAADASAARAVSERQASSQIQLPVSATTLSGTAAHHRKVHGRGIGYRGGFRKSFKGKRLRGHRGFGRHHYRSFRHHHGFKKFGHGRSFGHHGFRRR